MSSRRNTKIRLAVSCKHQVKKKMPRKHKKNYCQKDLCLFFFRAWPVLINKNHHPGLSPFESKKGGMSSSTCSPTLPKPKGKSAPNQLATYTGNVYMYYTSSPSMWHVLRFKHINKGSLQNYDLDIEYLRSSLYFRFNILYAFASLAYVVIALLSS